MRSRSRGNLAAQGSVPGGLRVRGPWGTPFSSGPQAQSPDPAPWSLRFGEEVHRREQAQGGLPRCPARPGAQARFVSLTPVHGPFCGSWPPGTEEKAELTRSLLGAGPVRSRRGRRRSCGGLSPRAGLSPSHRPRSALRSRTCARARLGVQDRCARTHARTEREYRNKCGHPAPPATAWTGQHADSRANGGVDQGEAAALPTRRGNSEAVFSRCSGAAFKPPVAKQTNRHCSEYIIYLV